MKLSKVAALCKARHDIKIINVRHESGSVTQWVGTRKALYPFYNMPIMDAKSAFVLFDVDEKKRHEISFQEMEAEDYTLCLEEHDETDIYVEPEKVGIAYAGSLYLPVDTTKGIRLINRAYIAPMQGKLDLLTFSERMSTSGEIYIVARLGLLIAGVIVPFLPEAEDTTLLDFSRIFADRMGYADDCRRAEQEALRQAEPEIVLVDRGTGEIIDEDTDDDGGDAA